MKAVRLGDVIKIHHGWAFPGSGFGTDAELPQLITPGNFEPGGSFVRRVKSFSGEFPSAFILEPGDLVVSMTDLSKEGATLGKPAIVPSDGIFLHNQRIGKVEILDESALDKNYLKALFLTGEFHRQILSTATGSTVRHTSPGRIYEFCHSLPELEAQRVIGEVLGALDDKIAANRKVCVSLRGLQGSIWSRASRSLPHIPLIELAPPRLGGTPARSSPELWGGGTPWASVRDMTGADLGVILSTAETITIKAAQPERLRPVPAGSVFLTARGTVGEVAVAGVDCACNQSAYAFIPQAGKSAALRLALEGAVAGLISRAHGSVFSTITTSTLADVEVPNFYDGSARRAVSELEVLEERVVTGLKENVSLARTRDELLPLLMSGKVGVKDAERAAEDVL